jgi:hypothetical protein
MVDRTQAKGFFLEISSEIDSFLVVNTLMSKYFSVLSMQTVLGGHKIAERISNFYLHFS